MREEHEPDESLNSLRSEKGPFIHSVRCFLGTGPRDWDSGVARWCEVVGCIWKDTQHHEGLIWRPHLLSGHRTCWAQSGTALGQAPGERWLHRSPICHHQGLAGPTSVPTAKRQRAQLYVPAEDPYKHPVLPRCSCCQCEQSLVNSLLENCQGPLSPLPLAPHLCGTGL